MFERFTVLQWNMNCLVPKPNDPPNRHKRLCEALSDLVADEKPDLLLLQEAADGADTMLEERGFLVAKKERLLTCIRRSDWVLQAEARPATELRVLVQTFRRLSDTSLLITWNVHLPSLVRSKAPAIEEAVRELVGHANAHRSSFDLDTREVIGGDLNLPPYNDHVMCSRRDFLRAGRSALWAQRQEQETGVRHFINTAWRLLGRSEEPLGTLYAEKDPVSYQQLDDAPWYQFDQVLLSPSLLRGRAFSCELRTSAGATDLSTARNANRQASRRRGSDHYPTIVQVFDPLAVASAVITE